MRKIRAKKTKKALGEVGVPAPVSEENFVTLTEPAFKPRLELISGDPETPPQFSNSDLPEGMTLNQDGTRPDAGNISNGLSDETIGDAKEDKPPHEDEKVVQDNNNLDEDQLQLNKNSSMTSQDDFRLRYKMAAKLADIKISNGLLSEGQRDNFTDYTSEHFNGEQIESYLQENKAWAEAMNKRSNKTASTEESDRGSVSRSPMVPTTSGAAVPGLKLANGSDIDPLEVICS